MKKRIVSASDVAKLAGVSRTTVSFILNNTPGKHISEATRQRVLQAASALEYVPDEDAVSIARRTHFTIGFFISHSSSIFTDAYIIRLIDGMALVFNKHRCRLVLQPLRQSQTNYVELVRSHSLDGVILINTHVNDPGILELEQAQIPLVVIGSIQGLHIPQVDIDNAAAAREMAEYLLSLGHTKIAMIVHAPISYYAAAHRLEGYRAAMEAAGLEINPEYIRIADFTEASGYRAMRELLDLKDRPTAVFAGNDVVAYGAMQAIQDAGLSIPEDISLAGFDDDYLSRYLNPPLTTVTQPAAGLGEAAARLLLKQILSTSDSSAPINTKSDETEGHRIILPTVLAQRESCRSVHHEQQ
ncbi:MAG TPA: LacI family DNA-binding transcriptional regulator [Treponema sp.]|jgi:LacI family transcriptional regulator|uniref:LacI family DNA-binding transcriptional regulator n=1 Tax=Gracilinema caldarium TaxID=215591 RepID=UPI0026EEF68B|nr:LacI family DNA-binding transcriptional regulator [Gracilinema caldarium]HPC72640.1 LacI family DNA-binding transcriptional regulator [Treponema sp.]HRS05119.1 LacI family DNA-binding transcriptional regulator [Treponema sp.]